MVLLDRLGHGLLIACGMAWKTGWSLILGFAISAFLQVVTPSDRLRALLGRDDAKALAIATAAGAASSSCSYASASIMRTLFKKGEALGPSLAFLIASTNLVLELGVILWLLTSGYSHVLAQNGEHDFELLHKPYSFEQLSRVLGKAIAWHRRRVAG